MKPVRNREAYQFVVIKTYDGTGEYKSKEHDIEAWLYFPPSMRIANRMKHYEDYEKGKSYDGVVFKNKKEFLIHHLKQLGAEMSKLNYKSVWKYGDQNILMKLLRAGAMVTVQKFLKTSSIFIFVEDKYQRVYAGD